MDTLDVAPGVGDDANPYGRDAIKYAAEDLVFRIHGLNRHSTNLALLKYYDFQGFLITGQQSGTHWVKWMLSHALAHRYGVDPPRYFNNDSSNDLIGHPKHRRIHPHLPRIASSHSIPAYALDWAWLRAVRRPPPYAVLVRDLRDALVSNFVQWRAHYGVSLSRYVAGDPRGKAYYCDAWWYVRFLNRWGDIASRYPDQTLVLRYEDFRQNPSENLDLLARHFHLDLSEADLQAGVAVGSKSFMLTHQDPRISERPVRPDGAESVSFSPADLRRLGGILERNLRHDFGYAYFDQPRGFQIPVPVRPPDAAEPPREAERQTRAA